MKATFAVTVLIAVVLGNSYILARQDDTAEAEAARQARQAAAAEAAALRAMEQKAIAEENARKRFIDDQQRRSESNLAAAEARAREAKARENETKFSALEQAAKELMNLSSRTYTQIRSSGAQSVSLTLYADVERMEKLLKEMRKHLK